jgi:Fe-S cluster assembly ATP-binding protein
MLKVQHLTASAADKTILDDVSFVFDDNKTYAIMGPNGSGKSTFIQSILGNPSYELSPKSRILLGTTKIHGLTPDKRAKKGIGVTFQSPLALQGVSVFQLLRIALPKVDPLKLYETIEHYAQELHIKKELLNRALNDGASGGERKKLEVLQMAVLNPSIIFFDEIDTGVDIDSLRTIFLFLKKIKKEKTYVFVTHYSRIFEFIQPDEVIVMKKGTIVKTGEGALVHEIETKGYESF